jgi:endoglucanase
VAGGIPHELPRLHLIRYGQDRWSASRIETEIVEVARWARKHHVRITCNEFGVFRHFASPVDRAAWIADVRTVLERHGIGWTVWDYAGDFGIVTKHAGATLVDEGIVRALGLRGTPVSEVIK